MFTVEYWGSDPSLCNDDFWCCFEFTSRDEAEAHMKDPSFSADLRSTEYFLLLEGDTYSNEGGEVLSRVKNPKFAGHEVLKAEMEAEDRAWARECALEAGMGLGCDGYNDYMGY